MNSPIINTPPSSNTNSGNTPDNGQPGVSQTRRSGTKKSSSGGSNVLKPKLRLHNNRGSTGGSSSSTSTVTSVVPVEYGREGSPAGKDKDGSIVGGSMSLMESSGEFFRAVMEKSEREEDAKVDSILRDGNRKLQGSEERIAACVEAFRNGVGKRDVVLY